MVKVRPYRRRGAVRGIEVDINVELPNGERFRERVLNPTGGGRTEGRVWGQDREREVLHLARQGLDVNAIKRRLRGEEVNETSTATPTLAEFWPRFVEGHARANQHKPSTIDTREQIYRNHLAPLLGSVRLDAIGAEQVQILKGRVSREVQKRTGTAASPKTVNGVLTALAKLLKVAVEWDVIRAMPCRIRLLKVAVPVVEFYEEPEYERLVEAARACDARTHVAVLLAGDAGLRLGEILGLEWPDVDLARGQLKIQRAVYEGETGTFITLPKGGKPRIVPTTARLRAALAAHRHLRGDRVLYQDGGEPASKEWLKDKVETAERRAGMRQGGRLHILRHTFCSRLAARNVPMLTIKALAGHESIETTMRYMHLASSAPRDGIRALEAPARGGLVEAPPAGEENSRNDA